MPRGNWVSGWGQNNKITENRFDGTRVFRLTINNGVFVVQYGG